MRSPQDPPRGSSDFAGPIRTSRRAFLAGAATLASALALDPRRLIAQGTGLGPSVPHRPVEKLAAAKHLAWVWQFRHDGEAAAIRDVLAAHGLGIALKTHDATSWMSRYDLTPEAVSGPKRVEELVRFFEDAGVPFYTWNVVHGVDPIEEARMAAATLDAGARGVFVDLEAHSGFWRGTPRTAEQYGIALRLLQSKAWVATTIDARPWELPRIPMAEFASFTDAIAPQVYWSAFTTGPNVRKYRAAGEDPGEEGVTARFALGSALKNLEPFGLPVHPIGDGTVSDTAQWSDFMDVGFTGNVQAFSVWRYGVVQPSILQLLRDTPPKVFEVQAATYVVQPGDTLGGLAQQWGTDVATIVQVNGLANPNLLSIGQVLINPHGSGTLPAPGASGASDEAAGSDAEGTTAAAPPPADAASGVYIVEPGDSLWALARLWGTTVEEIATLNGVSDPTRIRIGDELLIP